MDETSVWFDCMCGTTVDTVGTKTINIKTTGHEKAHCSVILAARGDGTKLAPYIVFKGNIRKVRSMSETPGAFVSSSKNGWFNNDLTKDWLLKALGGQTLESRRLLVWDSYRCHISEEVKQYVKLLNVGMAVVPGGCTKYIQAPDVAWNKGFKDKMTEYYDQWIANDENKEYTRGGNVKAVSIEVLTDWVRKAWESISVETIQNSFASCALTVAADGSEDFKIHCLKSGQPCHGAWEMLAKSRDAYLEAEGIIEQICEEDDEQLEANEVVIYESDEEEDGDACSK